MLTLDEIILPEDLRKKKISVIQELFRSQKVLVAFSGGVDSSLVLFFAKTFAQKAKGLLFVSPMTPSQERSNASNVAKEIQVPMEEFTINPLHNEAIRANTTRRCYYCKQAILTTLEQFAKEHDWDLCADGTNFSDQRLPRPGLQALQESAVYSPLALALLTKEEIIQISTLLELPSAKFPSQACLASRIPFDLALTEPLLIMADKSERFLRTLLGNEEDPLRVRIQPLHPSKAYLARIEAGQWFMELTADQEIRNQIDHKLKDFGFTFVTYDLAGFQSGSFHQVIDLDQI
ncbi:MAG: ATP-dependent sacrificial sulfur transferase LarE [Promethearchaeota archaeon]